MTGRRPRAASRAQPSARTPRTRATRPPKTPAVRDTEPSTFAHILADLVARLPGAMGAVFVDADGEAIDYAGELDPFELKLAGAHWQIVLSQTIRAFARTSAATSAGKPQSLVVRGARRSFFVYALPDDYALIVLLARRTFVAAARAYAICERALSTEAGWRIRARGSSTSWFALEVLSSRGRPTRIRHENRDHALEILGSIAGASIAPRERGWRVRLDSGAEITVVREPGGHWYGDESLSALFPATPSSASSSPKAR